MTTLRAYPNGPDKEPAYLTAGEKVQLGPSYQQAVFIGQEPTTWTIEEPEPSIVTFGVSRAGGKFATAHPSDGKLESGRRLNLIPYPHRDKGERAIKSANIRKWRAADAPGGGVTLESVAAPGFYLGLDGVNPVLTRKKITWFRADEEPVDPLVELRAKLEAVVAERDAWKTKAEAMTARLDALRMLIAQPMDSIQHVT